MQHRQPSRNLVSSSSDSESAIGCNKCNRGIIFHMIVGRIKIKPIKVEILELPGQAEQSRLIYKARIYGNFDHLR